MGAFDPEVLGDTPEAAKVRASVDVSNMARTHLTGPPWNCNQPVLGHGADHTDRGKAIRQRNQPRGGSGPKPPHQHLGMASSRRHKAGHRFCHGTSRATMPKRVRPLITWSACAVSSSSPRLRRATVFCISSSLAKTSSLVMLSTIPCQRPKNEAASISGNCLVAANSSTTVQASAGVAGAAMVRKGERESCSITEVLCANTSCLSQNGIRHGDSSVC